MIQALAERLLGKANSLLYREPPRRPAPAGARFHSRFGGLWTDQLDAQDILRNKAQAQAIAPWLQAKLDFFIAQGYVILEQAVPHAAIDAYLAQFRQAASEPGPLRASVPVQGPRDKGIVPLHRADLAEPLTKVLDTYHHLPAAREMIFSPALREFLGAVFEEDLLAFQGLHFEKGSTQSIHQDTAYVVLTEPMKLCASWIALEDVTAGSGELIYYPGSHRLPDWVYRDGRKHYNHRRDPHEEHLKHLQALHDRSLERGLKLEAFLPKKGDALIWSADLAHGGAPIADPALTRRSLVTHYTGASVTPHYVRYKSPQRRKPLAAGPGCGCVSFYY